MEYYVERMTCSGCARSVTKAILSIDQTAEISADPAKRKLVVQTTAAPGEVEAVLAEAGYPASRRPD